MDLREYLNVVRGRKWAIILATLIVAVTATVLSSTQPEVYESTAKVLINVQDTGAALLGTSVSEFVGQPERGLETQVQLMQLRPLAENAIRTLGLETTPNALLSSVEFSAIGDTNVVYVRAKSGDPETAADIADAMAEEYVEWSRDTKRESIRAAVAEVEPRLAEAEARILELGQQIDRDGEVDELSTELGLLTNTYVSLAEQLQQLRISEQLEAGSGRVVEQAVVGTNPVSPNPTRDGVLGLVVGLALGVALAFLFEYLDDTIKSNEEVEKILSVPVLGTIAREKSEKSGKRRLTIVESPGSSAAESYRVLRNSLEFVNFEHKIRTLVITSAAPAEGKSTIAANLAVSLSQAGNKVVLVSCDFRRPTTDHFFDVNNMIGLSDVLLGTHALKAALQRPGDESLLVLTSGKMPPNPSELLGSSKMKALIEELEEWADWVIVDTPPLLAVADSSAVSRWADGVLIVLRAGMSTRHACSKAHERLGMVGAHVVGAAVWGLDDGRKSGYGYGYYGGGDYYYSGYYRTTDTDQGKGSVGKDVSDGDWMDEFSLQRRIAARVRRALVGLLGFLVVLTIAAVVVYFADEAFGWGLIDAVWGLL